MKEKIKQYSKRKQCQFHCWLDQYWVTRNLRQTSQKGTQYLKEKGEQTNKHFSAELTTLLNIKHKADIVYKYVNVGFALMWVVSWLIPAPFTTIFLPALWFIFFVIMTYLLRYINYVIRNNKNSP